jgi:hypothetical protein
MPGDADPAAHRDAVGEGDERLGVFRDARVEGVLLTEELRRLFGTPAVDPVGEPPHVAAGAQPALARAVQQHDVDLGVVLPRVQRLVRQPDHAEVQRVDGSRAVERELSQSPARAGEDGGLGVGIGHERHVTALPLRAERRAYVSTRLALCMRVPP